MDLGENRRIHVWVCLICGMNIKCNIFLLDDYCILRVVLGSSRLTTPPAKKPDDCATQATAIPRRARPKRMESIRVSRWSDHFHSLLFSIVLYCSLLFTIILYYSLAIIQGTQP